MLGVGINTTLLSLQGIFWICQQILSKLAGIYVWHMRKHLLGFLCLTFLAPLVKGQQGIWHGSAFIVHASIHFFLVRAMKWPYISLSVWTKLVWSVYGHKISNEFNNEQNPPSNSRVIGLERLKIAVLNLGSMIETWFVNQSGLKLHKVFISSRPWISSIMREIHPETLKLVVLELLKIAVWTLIPWDHISKSVWTKVAQSIYRHKISVRWVC